MAATSMYQASVPVFQQLLGGLNGFLGKGAEQATARKLDQAVLLNLRLYPDMFTLARQVQQAVAHAVSGAGRVAGVELPKFADADTSFDEMRTRVSTALEFLNTIKPAQLDGQEDKQVSLPMGGQTRTFRAQAYLFHMAMPNVYFHITTAYNILRQLGFDIGKRDFLGAVPS